MHGDLSHNLIYFPSVSSVGGCMARVGSSPCKPVSRRKQEDLILFYAHHAGAAGYRRLCESYAQDPSRRPRATWGQTYPKIGCRARARCCSCRITQMQLEAKVGSRTTPPSRLRTKSASPRTLGSFSNRQGPFNSGPTEAGTGSCSRRHFFTRW